jgi:hypothetical protein
MEIRAQQSGVRIKKLIALRAGREEHEAERFGASHENPNTSAAPWIAASARRRMSHPFALLAEDGTPSP